MENYANIEAQKVAKWARSNKMSFNEQKSKVTIITKKKPRNRREFKIYLNNKKLKQEDAIKYLGITKDRCFNFNQHTDITEMHKDYSRTFKISKNQLGTEIRRSTNHTHRSNITHFIIWSTGMDRVPGIQT